MDKQNNSKKENGHKKLTISQTIIEENESEEDEYDNYQARLIHLHRNDPMSFSGPYTEDAKILDDSPTVIRAIITGASDGIGKAIALELAKNPQKVALFLTGKTEDKLTGITQTISKMGCKVGYEVGEFSKEEDIENMFKRGFEFLGEGIDVVCLNGGAAKVGNRLEDTKLSDFDDMIGSNLKAYFLWLKKILPVMRKQNSGQIILVSSTLGLEPLGRCSAYCATKFALQGMILSLRQELEGTQIKICTLHPDTVEAILKMKNMSSKSLLNGPSRPPVEPDDVAKAARTVIEQNPSSNIEQIILKSSKR